MSLGQSGDMMARWREGMLELRPVSDRESSRTGHALCVQRLYQDHPSPVFKTFSTRLAAEAYISGWDGAGRHSLPVRRASAPSLVATHDLTGSRHRPARCANTSP